MALLSRANGATSNILRVKLLDSSDTTGAGLTGLTSASTGMTISTIADNEATGTSYTVAGSTIESITTLGTFAAPTATKVRFKEVDSTYHKGVYELQIADARFAVSGAKSLLVSIRGATNLAQCDFVIDLQPAADVQYYGGTAGTFASGRPEVNLTHWKGTAAATVDTAGYPKVTVKSGTGTGEISLASGRANADLVYWNGSAVASPDTAGYPKVTIKNGTGTGEVALSSGRANADVVYVTGSAVNTASAQLGVNVVNAGGTAWNSGAVTTSTFASGAINAAAIAADAIGASELATDAVTEIVTAVMAAVVESNNSIPLSTAVRTILAAVAGVTASGGTVLKDPSGTTTRITATIDGSNNRTAMTIS